MQLQTHGAATLLLTISLLAGCVNTPKAPIAKYDKAPEQLYPGISLFYKSPSDELKNKCSGFDQKSVFHHCTINRFENTRFIQEFKNTNLFHNVFYQADDIDYKFYIQMRGDIFFITVNSIMNTVSLNFLFENWKKTSLTVSLYVSKVIKEDPCIVNKM